VMKGNNTYSKLFCLTGPFCLPVKEVYGTRYSVQQWLSNLLSIRGVVFTAVRSFFFSVSPSSLVICCLAREAFTLPDFIRWCLLKLNLF